MEIHICKLCSKSFSNGRSLGGHMRSHLPSSVSTNPKTGEQLGSYTESDSSSTRSDTPSYVLRVNPKKSSKGSDPALFLDSGSVVQDRESETESTRNPTRRRRSKKRVATWGHRHGSDNGSKRVKSESATESTPASSVSDPSQDEEVATWLMMLSRDVWVGENDSTELTRNVSSKRFKTKRVLISRKTTTLKVSLAAAGFDNEKIYECPFCYKVFGSGQALGGHKRSHLLKSSKKITSNRASNHGINNNDNIIIASNIGETNSFVLDLNLPAPVHDEDDEKYS